MRIFISFQHFISEKFHNAAAMRNTEMRCDSCHQSLEWVSLFKFLMNSYTASEHKHHHELSESFKNSLKACDDSELLNRFISEASPYGTLKLLLRIVLSVLFCLLPVSQIGNE